MESLIFYLISSVGISFIWSLSDLFMPIRNIVAKRFVNPFKKMLLCMECSSFWIGLANGIVFFSLSSQLFLHNLTIFPIYVLITAFLGGAGTHCLIKILHKIIE